MAAMRRGLPLVCVISALCFCLILPHAVCKEKGGVTSVKYVREKVKASDEASTQRRVDEMHSKMMAGDVPLPNRRECKMGEKQSKVKPGEKGKKKSSSVTGKSSATTTSSQSCVHGVLDNQQCMCKPGYTSATCSSVSTLSNPYLSPLLLPKVFYDQIPLCAVDVNPPGSVCDIPPVVSEMARRVEEGEVDGDSTAVYVPAFDNGSDPLISAQQTSDQVTVLNAEYGKAGITFEAEQVVYHSSAFRSRHVIGCELSWLGDGECDQSCNFPITAYDGGDCLSSTPICPKQWIGDGECDEVCDDPQFNYDGGDCHTCYPGWIGDGECDRACATTANGADGGDCSCPASWQGDGMCDAACNYEAFGYDGGDCPNCAAAERGNGVCNEGCNYPVFDYDDGDCCNPSLPNVASTCRDPSSPNKGYYTEKEALEYIDTVVDGELTAEKDAFKVLATSEPEGGTGLGMAFFPPEFTSQSVIWIYRPEAWGVVSGPGGAYLGDTATHEVGHAFGLLHTFAFNTDGCDSMCYESQPVFSTAESVMTKGDLISDTRPTPVNYECYNPVSDKTCLNTAWTNTPYHNFMGYGNDACLNNFSPLQRGRMRCYNDLVYGDSIFQPSSVDHPLLVMGVDAYSEAAQQFASPSGAAPTSISACARGQECAYMAWIPSLQDRRDGAVQYDIGWKMRGMDKMEHISSSSHLVEKVVLPIRLIAHHLYGEVTFAPNVTEVSASGQVELFVRSAKGGLTSPWAPVMNSTVTLAIPSNLTLIDIMYAGDTTVHPSSTPKGALGLTVLGVIGGVVGAVILIVIAVAVTKARKRSVKRKGVMSRRNVVEKLPFVQSEMGEVVAD
eukprot:CAMPEP_0113916610 /NCGR_PEP_ID=MMETSP0780_2-20120614/32175_1 /TAXON_ID=652834 /ORGANISM="Palpitomonas bilix" /LENGTH=840 /DNA_ID=CAMNT_0000915893 /DNA_START=70 /DNA_END=2593 /DNA_ORIENTATION=- /assembly_acc=CAM_ASM_000599